MSRMNENEKRALIEKLANEMHTSVETSENVDFRCYVDSDIIDNDKLAKSDVSKNMFACTQAMYDRYIETFAIISKASNNRVECEITFTDNYKLYEFRCKDALAKVLETKTDLLTRNTNNSHYRHTEKFSLSERYQHLNYDELLTVVRLAVASLRSACNDYETVTHTVTKQSKKQSKKQA